MTLPVHAARHIDWRPRANAVVRRTFADFVLLTWIVSLIVCPAPVMANSFPAPTGAPLSLHAHGHAHDHINGVSDGTTPPDPCCAVLGKIDVAATSLTKPLHFVPATNPTQVAIVVSSVVTAATDKPISLKAHGPEPPRLPWPQFSKIQSRAPPVNHL